MDQVLMDLLESSSSSSSSSEDEIFFPRKENEFDDLENLLFGDREIPNSNNFVKDVVVKYSDYEFRKEFRVSRKTATKIIEMFAKSNHYRRRLHNGGRPSLSAEEHCLAFLWFAGKKKSYREVSHLFNISFSTMFRTLTQFMLFLFDVSSKFIKFPKSSAEKTKISEEFEKIAGLKNVIGCIDGIYIHIRKPARRTRSTFVNRDGLISITLQGICDAENKFLDVFVGCPGKNSDSNIYNLSSTFEDIPTICGNQYHILGSSAYPLREYLLTPYCDDGYLSLQQKMFNRLHLQTRNKIENCFSLLKKRFKQLVRLDFFSLERNCKFLLACCILHNICISEGDLWHEIKEEKINDVEDQTQSREIENLIHFNGQQHSGVTKRDLIAQNLKYLD